MMINPNSLRQRIITIASETMASGLGVSTDYLMRMVPEANRKLITCTMNELVKAGTTKSIKNGNRVLYVMGNGQGNLL